MVNLFRFVKDGNAFTSYKHHLLIGFLISIWLVAFLVIIAPFDVAELPLKYRLELMPFYGVIALTGYLVLIPLQNWIFSKTKSWTIYQEVGFIFCFNTLVLIGSYAYYKSSYLNGAYSFKKFTLEVYYPTFILLLSTILFARWFLFRKKPESNIQKIILKGENKRDVLQINLSDLVCVSSADNYVEVNYLKDGKLHKKLLRNTLKNIQEEEAGLVKVHRSHLINPSHFIAWKNSNTIILNHLDVPVSKKYSKALSSLVNRP